METMTPSEVDRASSSQFRSQQALVWQEIQQACYALGGAHGPQRKATKQKLREALERLPAVVAELP